MKIIKMDSPNYGYPRGSNGRKGNSIIAIVNHVSGGNWESNKNWIMNPNASVSYNYYVRTSGEIICFVDPENAAYSNGRVEKPTWSLLKDGVNPNLYTVSVCREGHNHHEPTTEQYEGILYCNKMLIDKYNIPKDRQHIIGHNEIDSVNRWYCPGRGFPWDRLMNDLKAVANEGNYIVKSGDTLYAIAKRFGSSVDDIAEINNINNPNIIKPGDELIIPNKDHVDIDIPVPTGTLRATSPFPRGSDVKELQEILSKLDYEVGSIDGIYGPKTAGAVRSFQRDSNITVDGIYGPQTEKALKERIG